MQSDYMNKSPRVRLDDYICDLNLEVAPGGYVCYPLSSEGFSYMWGGCKATYGIRSGKVCFEVKILEYNQVTCQDVDTHVARVGWSTDDATLQLGEDKNSFGFGGTGKKSVNRKFANYGRRFEKGDVVGCYLAMENGWVDISYTVNGRFCGSAFKIRWMTDEALFPHVLTKNCKLEVNFGQASHPYYSLQPGYKLIDHTPPEFRISAVRPPHSQNDCEVIMMVGLPGVGKSTWAANYAKIHPSKKYVILGTDSIIDKMRVQGLPRKNNFSGRWDVLIKQATDCFNVLLKKASNLPRNLILDQTNVYASARRRKVKQYREKGYTINAMVLVPRDEDMIRRSAQRTLEEGKEVPESAVLDMKANFSLPYEGENLFDSITFLELQRAEAQAVVERYNREAMGKGHQSNRQKGFASNMNQMERGQINRYYDNQPSSHQAARSDGQYNHPPQQAYQDDYRGANKRPDPSNYAPPEKYRRSDPTPSFNQEHYAPQSNANYARDPNLSRPAGMGQWESPGQGAGRQPVVKEEPRYDSRGYGESYGRPPPRNDHLQAGDWQQQQQYSSNIKPEPRAREDNFPRQGLYESTTGYQSQNYEQQLQNPSASEQARYSDPYTSYEVKKEPPTPSGWYEQGDRNHSTTARPQDSFQANSQPHRTQQHAFNDTNQQYSASTKGYGADVKTEDWSTRDRSQQYGNEQSYGKPNNSYDSAFDSFADGSNSNQQWQQSGYNRDYAEPHQPSYNNVTSAEKPPGRVPPAEQYGDYPQAAHGGRSAPRFDRNEESGSFPKQERGSSQSYDQDRGYYQSNPPQSGPPNSGFSVQKREADFTYNDQNWSSRTSSAQQNWQDNHPIQDADWQAERKDPTPDFREGQRFLPGAKTTPVYADPNRLRDSLSRPGGSSQHPDNSWSSNEGYSDERPTSRFGEDKKLPSISDRDRMSSSFDSSMTKQDNFSSSSDRRPRERSPASSHSRGSSDSRRGRRGDSSSRRGAREDSHHGRSGESGHRRGERADSRHSPRDESRRGGSRRSRDDDSHQRRGEDPRSRGGRRGSRDRDRGESRDRSRLRGARREDREGERSRDRKRSSERTKNDRSREERRRDDPIRDRSRSDVRSNDRSIPPRSRPDDRRNPPANSADPPKPSSTPAPSQNEGVLSSPKPGPPTNQVPTSRPAPPANQNILNDHVALSKLSNVDFDKLRAGLASMRERSKNMEEQSSPVKVVQGPEQAGGEDMDLVSDEEANQTIQQHKPRTSLPQPRAPLGPRPRIPVKGALLGVRPEMSHRPPRPRPRLDAPPPRPRPRHLLETQSGHPLPSREERFRGPRHAPPRRPLLDTPRTRDADMEHDDLYPPSKHHSHYGEESAPLRPALPSRPRMRPPGVRIVRPPGPGVRPRLRPPGPRGFGRPPLIRGPPRRPLLARYASPI